MSSLQEREKNEAIKTFLKVTILGDFTTNQLARELTKISQYQIKTTEKLKSKTETPKRRIDGQN